MQDNSKSMKLILRRALYCGIACVMAVALAFTLEWLPLYRLRIQIWGVDLEGILVASFFSAAMCLGTVLAVRKIRLIPLAIVVSFLVGLVAHKIGKEFLWALYPDDYEIGLGGLGKFIDQHYSLMFGFNAGALASNFLARLLSALFCASLRGNLRALVGGLLSGFILALLALLLSFWTTEVIVFESEVAVFVGLMMAVPQIFLHGAIFGGGIALGEHLGLSTGKQSGAENVGSNAAY